jgi:AcrR family transcriptional regulator
MHAVKVSVGRRLKPHVRREQLLDTGAAMFAEMPYDDVFVEDIAARAGVSRALFYHYYESKRDIYVAMFQRASTQFLARVRFDPQLPLAEQLVVIVDAHIQSFVDHRFEAITINRGVDDPAIRAIITEELTIVGQPLIDQLVADGRLRDTTEIAVESWLAFVRAACVKWIESQNIAREDVTEMCLRAFDCTLVIPISTSRMRARLSGVVQSPAISSLIRRSRSAALARVPGASGSHDTSQLAASSADRPLFTRRRP